MNRYVKASIAFVIFQAPLMQTSATEAADNTPVNSQITDAITQVNTKVLGDAPAVATGNFMIATSQALSNAAHNATNSQLESNVTAQAATTLGVSVLCNVDTASTARAARAVLGSSGHTP